MPRGVRHMSYNPDELAELIVDKMKRDNRALWIDPEIHSEQHRFIAEMIEERKERHARRARIAEKIAGSVILSGLVFLVTIIGASAIQWLKSHLWQS